MLSISVMERLNRFAGFIKLEKKITECRSNLSFPVKTGIFSSGCKMDRSLFGFQQAATEAEARVWGWMCQRERIHPAFSISPFHCSRNYHCVRVTNSGGSHYAMIWVASAYTGTHTEHIYIWMYPVLHAHPQTGAHSSVHPHAHTYTKHLDIKPLICNTRYTEACSYVHLAHMGYS